ncbi:hypothetical protein ACERII_23950 [Evansella sp. AB-rgal1]|uniref:hypothetical protein n=1 Tax=Evansella sp. AB-rgal1 TaxID=3242696 RepID=UPI00359DF0C7
MNSSNKPIREIVLKIKGVLGILEKEIVGILIDGSKVLKKRKRNQKLYEISFPDVSEEIGSNADSILRKIRRMKKISIEDICVSFDENKSKNSRLEQVIFYCELLSLGILEYKDAVEDSAILVELSNEIIKYKESIIDYITKYSNRSYDEKLELTENTKELHKQGEKSQLIKTSYLYEEIFDFLSNVDITTEEDWKLLEENLNYRKLIVIRKEASFYFSEPYNHMAFKIIETYIDDLILLLSIGTFEEFDIQEYSSIKEVLQSIISIINSLSDIELFTYHNYDSVESSNLDRMSYNKKMYYDSIETLNEKFQYLLY